MKKLTALSLALFSLSLAPAAFAGNALADLYAREQNDQISDTDMLRYAIQIRALQQQQAQAQEVMRLKKIEQDAAQRKESKEAERVKQEQMLQAQEEARLKQLAEEKAAREAELLRQQQLKQEREKFLKDISVGWNTASGSSDTQVSTVIQQLISSDDDIDRLKRYFLDGESLGKLLYSYGKTGKSLWKENNPVMQYVTDDDRSIYEYAELFYVVGLVLDTSDPAVIKREFSKYLERMNLSVFKKADILAYYLAFFVERFIKDKTLAVLSSKDVMSFNSQLLADALNERAKEDNIKPTYFNRVHLLNNALRAITSKNQPLTATALVSQLKSPS